MFSDNNISAKRPPVAAAPRKTEQPASPRAHPIQVLKNISQHYFVALSVEVLDTFHWIYSLMLDFKNLFKM